MVRLPAVWRDCANSRGRRGRARMSDTRALLSRITDLRKRLAQAQGLLLEAGATAAAVKDAPPGTDLAEQLERDVIAGGRVQELLDGSLRQIAGALRGEDMSLRPTQL